MYMGKLGYTYDEILGFYYEGCQRVRKSFTSTILSASSSEKDHRPGPRRPAGRTALPARVR